MLKRKLVLMGAVIFTILCLMGCGEKNPFLGTWEGKVSKGSCRVTLLKDGKCIFEISVDKYEGTYTIEDDKLLITIPDENPIYGALDEDTLVLSVDEVDLVLQRVVETSKKKGKQTEQDTEEINPFLGTWVSENYLIDGGKFTFFKDGKFTAEEFFLGDSLGVYEGSYTYKGDAIIIAVASLGSTDGMLVGDLLILGERGDVLKKIPETNEEK